MERYDRQIRVFGRYGQEILRRLTVAIVGAGGIGSLVLVLLVRLGVGRIIVIDDDVVEVSNLNRLAGATLEDARKKRPKVQVLAEYAARINPAVKITTVQDSIMNASAQGYLKICDILFGCTDNQSTRWIENKFAVEHCTPYFDTGTGIKAGPDHTIEHAGGQVRVVVPGTGCLHCIDGIKVDIAEQEMRSEEEREIHTRLGYIEGANMKAPAVATLNGVIANLAVTEFMAYVTGFRPVHRFVGYDFMNATVLTYTFPRDPNCYACNPLGALAIGDGGQPLPIELLIDEPERDNMGGSPMQTQHNKIGEAITELLSQAAQKNLSIEGSPENGWFVLERIRLGRPFNRAFSSVMIKFVGENHDPMVLLPDTVRTADNSGVCPNFIAATPCLKGWKALCPHMFQDVGEELLLFITCLCGFLANPDLCGCLGCPGRDTLALASGPGPEASQATEND